MQSETYGHGLVVAPISAWLLWRIRDRWLAVTPGMSWWGLPLVVLGSAGWLVAELAKVNVAAQYGLLMILWGLTWTALGSAVVRLMLFPLAFLFFMVPAGDSLNAPLMEATATATIAALRAVGLPVYREGMLFTLPTGSWSVVEACSGLRYVLAAAMLGALFSYLNFRSWRLRVSFFVAAIVLALVGNWARAWLVVMIGHLSEMRYGTGDDHVWYGWAFFGVVMGGLFWMGGRFQERTPAAPETQTPTAPLFSENGAQRAASMHKQVGIAANPGMSVIHGLLLLAGLAVSISVVLYADIASQGATRSNLPGFDRLALESSVSMQSPTTYSWHGARLQTDRQFSSASGISMPAVQIHGAYFADQQTGHEMISPDNQLRLRKPEGWSSIRVRSLKPEADAPAQDPLRSAWIQEHLIARGDQRRLMWVWYEIDGQRLHSESMVKARTAWSMLRGLGDHSCLWVMLTDLEDSVKIDSAQTSESAARERLRARFPGATCE